MTIGICAIMSGSVLCNPIRSQVDSAAHTGYHFHQVVNNEVAKQGRHRVRGGGEVADA